MRGSFGGGGRGRYGGGGGRGRSSGRGRGTGRHGRGFSYGSGRSGKSSGRSGKGHLGKNVYRSTTYGSVGKPGSPGSFNTATIKDASGKVISQSRAYGTARADGGFGQVGTGRGSFRSNFLSGVSPRFPGGGGPRFPAPESPPERERAAPVDPPEREPSEPRRLRIRESPARRTALNRGSKLRARRRSARVSPLGGLGGQQNRSGINTGE